jgi:hypothetical protein
MKRWLNWTYVSRAIGVAVIALGAYWHDGSIVIAGVGALFGPDAIKGRG